MADSSLTSTATQKDSQNAPHPKLMIIIASVRQGRVGLPVGRWFTALAEAQSSFDIDLVELAELNLPLMDEPLHPRLRQYSHDHTKAWSRRVDAADAFVFVMPEYNYSFSAPLKNALDYLFIEWRHKPLGFVTYGGVSAGTRAMVGLQPVLQSLQITAVQPAVNIPFVAQFLTEDGKLEANEVMTKAAQGMFEALLRACVNQSESTTS